MCNSKVFLNLGIKGFYSMAIKRLGTCDSLAITATNCRSKEDPSRKKILIENRILNQNTQKNKLYHNKKKTQ